MMHINNVFVADPRGLKASSSQWEPARCGFNYRQAVWT